MPSRTATMEGDHAGPPRTWSSSAESVDVEDVAARAAVDSGLVSMDQARAAYLVSRLTHKPFADVLAINRVVPPPVAQALDAHARDNLISGYRLLDELGRGSQGVVYRAVQKCLNRVVALKVVTLSAASCDSMHHRLQREACAIARLNHPNVVAAYDYGESRGRRYLAMEYVEGRTCEKELREGRGFFRKERALAIVRDVALGLESAQDLGIIHRDIKPGNILLPARPANSGSGSSVHAKVTDLGLARMEVSDLTLEGAILGTPGYMAPEQARGERIDHRADIYALGATLYHLLTGRRPFGGGELLAMFLRQASGKLPDPRTFQPELPSGIVYLLQGMLSRDPATRYRSYRELIEDLDRAANNLKPFLPLPPPRHRTIDGCQATPPEERPSSVDMGSRILILDRSPAALSALLKRAAWREYDDFRAGLDLVFDPPEDPGSPDPVP